MLVCHHGAGGIRWRWRIRRIVGGADPVPGLGAVMTAVMAFRWSPPISAPPPKIWSPAMPHCGVSSRPSPSACQIIGVGEARNRTRRAVERTVPFGFICFSVVTVWYTLHGHAPQDVVTGHRTRARWYTTKTEPSYDDMAVKLRRVIIAARFRGPCPEQATPQETRAVLAAWAAAGTSSTKTAKHELACRCREPCRGL